MRGIFRSAFNISRAGAIWSVVAQRVAGNWKMLAVLALGVTVSATLLAAAPIYSRAMSDLGLTFSIREELGGRVASHVEFNSVALGTAEGRALDQAISSRIDERVGWFAERQTRTVRLGRFSIAAEGAEPRLRAQLGQPLSANGYRDKVSVLEGRLPGEPVPGGPLEVVASESVAALAGFKVGQTFRLIENFDTCERIQPTEEVPPPPPPCDARAILGFEFRATLVGIVAPRDPLDPFWIGGAEAYFQPRSRVLYDAGPVLPLLTDEAALIGGFGSLFPGYRATFAWDVYANAETLTRTNFRRAQDDQRKLQSEVEPLGGFAFSPLTDTLKDFGRSSDYQQKPLTILLLEIAAIAVFYVSLVSGVVVERQAREIALFQGRGASVVQVVLVYLLEGLLVGIPALVVAPFMAASATALLGLTPLFHDVSGGDLLPVTVPPLSFALAGLGVVLALVALLTPAWLVARRGALAQRRSESRPGRGVVTRYYLDLVLAMFAGLLLWELNERGSVFTPSESGGVTSDPVLLASPALIIAAAAAVTLRFYPLVLRLATRVLAAVSGVTVAVGLWQVVRNPGQHTRLMLLLMMAVAVGTFAASYSTTAERSYRDRASFDVGVDARVTPAGASRIDATSEGLATELGQFAGVTRAVAVVRSGGTLAGAGSGGQSVQLLAVDPAAAATMLWFRGDLAKQTLPELMGHLGGVPASVGRALPADSERVSVWLNSGATRTGVTAWIRVLDARGVTRMLELGTLDAQGWRNLATALPSAEDMARPLSITSILFTGPPNVFALSAAPVYIDDITAVSATGKITGIEDFEQGVGWALAPARGSVDTFAVNADSPHTGAVSGRYTFGGATGDALRAIYPISPIVPLPAIVSDSLGLPVGATTLVSFGQVSVPIVVRATFKLFPTMRSHDGPAVVLNRDYLVAWMAVGGDGGRQALNEVWFGLQPGADIEQLRQDLDATNYVFGTLIDRQSALTAINNNPLIAAGGTGILLVSFLAVLMLVAAAVVVTMWMGVQRRRVEFAVLRAIGLSRGQVGRVLALEFGLIGSVGVIIGGYLGLVVGRQMLSFLNVTETGAKVEPGFVLVTQWSYVAAGGAAIAVVFLLALVGAVRVLARTSDASELRTE